jgi:hypothetical protein
MISLMPKPIYQTTANSYSKPTRGLCEQLKHMAGFPLTVGLAFSSPSNDGPVIITTGGANDLGVNINMYHSLPQGTEKIPGPLYQREGSPAEVGWVDPSWKYR